MPEREYVKSHEFDRVLHYFWAEQELSTGIFAILNLQKAARLKSDQLAEQLEKQPKAHISMEDRTHTLEVQKRALENLGGLDGILEKHREALESLTRMEEELNRQKEAIDAVGGLDRLLQQHKMFMAAAREFSPIFTIEHDKRFGKPCIRGIRMTITDVLEYQSSGMTDEEILDDFPDLYQEDLDVCRAFGHYMEEQFKSM